LVLVIHAATSHVTRNSAAKNARPAATGTTARARGERSGGRRTPEVCQCFGQLVPSVLGRVGSRVRRL
jgi:hypothetical protein